MTLEVPYRSIPDMFLKRVAATPDSNAFAHPAPDDSGPVVADLGRRSAERAKAIAAGLRGARRRAARTGWRSSPTPGSTGSLADLGIMCAGGATTTVYPTTEPEDAAYIVSDSGSKVLIAENAAQAGQARRRRPAGADPRRAHRRRGRPGRHARRSSRSPTWRSAAPRRWPPSPT